MIASVIVVTTSCFAPVNDVLEVHTPPPGSNLTLMFDDCVAGLGYVTVDLRGIAVVGNRVTGSSLRQIDQVQGLDQDGGATPIRWAQREARDGLRFELTPLEGSISGFTLTDPTVLVRDRMIIRAASAQSLTSSRVRSPSGVIGFEVLRVVERGSEVEIAIRAILDWEDLEVVGPDGLSLQVGDRAAVGATEVLRVPSLGPGVVVARFPVQDGRAPARLSIAGIAVTFFGSFDVQIPYCR